MYRHRRRHEGCFLGASRREGAAQSSSGAWFRSCVPGIVTVKLHNSGLVHLQQHDESGVRVSFVDNNVSVHA